MNIKPLAERIEESICRRDIVVQTTIETHTSFVAFGKRNDQPVVLKVLRQPGDEWRSGEVLETFAGSGMVRVYEYVEGAVLLERLYPGTSLVEIALQGRDEEAVEIIAEVIQRLSHPRSLLQRVATAEDWGKSFQSYLASGDDQIPRRLAEEGQRLYAELCASQRGIRLLHGDLQHYNILFDYERDG